MKQLHAQKSPEVTDELFSLACGPDPRVVRYSGCIVKGIRFHTNEREKIRKTQNSGVVVKGEHEDCDMDFFGILTDIIGLNYCGGNQVFIFKCDWWHLSNRKGICTDEHFTSINISHTWYKDDPFVLASQAEQVFYLEDTKLKGNWHVVQEDTIEKLI